MRPNPDCYFGDHAWSGGSCALCGERLRCMCGQFISIEFMDAHFETCPVVRRLAPAVPVRDPQEPHDG